MKQSDVAIGKAIAPAIEALGLELWGIVQIRQGRSVTLRVYIDCMSGVTVGDCARVSRQVSAILDVEEPIQGEYTLEVSSPGIDRPLFTLQQFERYLAHEVSIRLRVPVEGRRRIRGVIDKVLADKVVLQVDGEAYEMLHADIERAGLAPPADAVLPRGGKQRGSKRVKTT